MPALNRFISSMLSSLLARILSPIQAWKKRLWCIQSSNRYTVAPSSAARGVYHAILFCFIALSTSSSMPSSLCIEWRPDAAPMWIQCIMSSCAANVANPDRSFQELLVCTWLYPPRWHRASQKLPSNCRCLVSTLSLGICCVLFPPNVLICAVFVLFWFLLLFLFPALSFVSPCQSAYVVV